MGNHTIIQKGNDFLPNTRISYLRKCHKREKDPKAATRLLAYIYRKEGYSTSKIADLLNKSHMTIYRWLLRAVEAGGISDRYDHHSPGAPCKLNKDQLTQLKKDLIAGPRQCGFESGVWTARLATMYVMEKFGVQYEARGMYDLLIRLGFSYKKPRPSHPKAASKRKQERFKKRAMRIIKKYAAKGYTILVNDESSNILGWNIKGGWYIKGRRFKTPISLSRKRFYSFGALYKDGFDCIFYEHADQYNFVHFLGEMYKKHGKFVMFLDNASYHTSKLVQKEIAKFDGDVVLVYFPPYTPELNPVEMQWNVLKKSTANTLYAGIDEMQESIRTMLRNGEAKIIQLSQYLTP